MIPYTCGLSVVNPRSVWGLSGSKSTWPHQSCAYGTRNIKKKLAVLATHEDGVTPKTLDSHYVKDIMYYFDNPEKPHSTL